MTSTEPLWYTLADVAAAELLTGREVEALLVIRLEPTGSSIAMRSVRLRGAVEIDPFAKDPMMAMVEERQRVKAPTDDRPGFGRPQDGGQCRLLWHLQRVQPPGAAEGGDDPGRGPRSEGGLHRPGGGTGGSRASTASPRSPACITGAARLMLAMLERCVTDLGGTWAFCDTDSMAIVATEDGGSHPMSRLAPSDCPKGHEAVRALSYAQVEAIRERFNRPQPLRPGGSPAHPEVGAPERSLLLGHLGQALCPLRP